MNTRKQLAALAVLGAALFASDNVQAEIMNFQFTCHVQGPTITTGTLETTKSVTVRITTKDILKFLGASLDRDFTGATLHDFVDVDDQGDYFHIILVVKGTLTLADVSDYFVISSEDIDVYDARYDTATDRSSFRGYYTERRIIDDSPYAETFNNYFSLTGLAVETASRSAVASNGIQSHIYSQVYTGTGQGYFSGIPSALTGTITTKGRWTTGP